MQLKRSQNKSLSTQHWKKIMFFSNTYGCISNKSLLIAHYSINSYFFKIMSSNHSNGGMQSMSTRPRPSRHLFCVKNSRFKGTWKQDQSCTCLTTVTLSSPWLWTRRKATEAGSTSAKKATHDKFSFFNKWHTFSIHS